MSRKKRPQDAALLRLWGYRIADPFEPESITLLWPNQLDWACDRYGDQLGYTITFTIPGAKPSREFFERFERERAAVIAGVPERVLKFVPEHGLWVYRRNGYAFQTSEAGEDFDVGRGVLVDLIEGQGRRRWLGQRHFAPGHDRDPFDAFTVFCERWAAEAPRFDELCRCRRNAERCRTCLDK